MSNALTSNSFRYINELDIIASFLDLFYYQVNIGFSFHSFDIIPSPACEHSLQTYIYLLSPPGTKCNTNCCTKLAEQKSALDALYEGRKRKTV